jgi:hypothetical protein
MHNQNNMYIEREREGRVNNVFIEYNLYIRKKMIDLGVYIYNVKEERCKHLL